MSIIRYPADRPAVAQVIAVLGAQLWIFFAVESHWAALGLVLLLGGLQVSCGAICHNHHHVKTFRVDWLNRLYESVLYLQTGTSPFSWTIHHNIGHHGHYLEPHEDPSGWQHRDGRMMGRLFYCLYNSARVYPEIMRIGRQYPAVYRRFKIMFVIANIPLVAFLAMDATRTLIVFVGPMIAQILLLLDNTYGQHAGTGTDSHYHASRNVELPLYNLTSWNLGYHTAHHLHPGVHWSELPALHEKIRDRIPEELITNTYLLQWVPGREQESARETG
jgi:beta-carotene hydroxylase